MSEKRDEIPSREQMRAMATSLPAANYGLRSKPRGLHWYKEQILTFHSKEQDRDPVLRR